MKTEECSNEENEKIYKKLRENKENIKKRLGKYTTLKECERGGEKKSSR
jgi:hypothetical protein